MTKSRIFSLLLASLFCLLIIRGLEYYFLIFPAQNSILFSIVLNDILTGLKLTLIFLAVYFLISIVAINKLLNNMQNIFDGRWLIISGLALYSIIVIYSQIGFGDHKYLLRYMGIPAHIRYNFNDLRVITSAMDCITTGKDPLLEGNCNPKLIYNYPRIWYILHYLGLGEKHTIPLALFLITSFLTTIFLFVKKLNVADGIIWSLILISPPVILAIERCNNDIIIFTLLALSIFQLKRKKLNKYWGYLLMLISAVLKLYPVFALVAIFREHKRNRLKVGFLLGIPLFIYSILNFNEFELVNTRSPRPAGSYAFGAFTWVDNLNTYLRLAPNYTLIIIIGICVLIFVIFIFSIYHSFTYPANTQNSLNLDAFRIGAGIFIGCFIMGNNYDYRLIFLLFCIPQILSWLKEGTRNKQLNSLAIIAIIMFMQYNFALKHFFPGIQEFHAKAILSWIVFGYLVYQLIVSLPVPVKRFR